MTSKYQPSKETLLSEVLECSGIWDRHPTPELRPAQRQSEEKRVTLSFSQNLPKPVQVVFEVAEPGLVTWQVFQERRMDDEDSAFLALDLPVKTPIVSGWVQRTGTLPGSDEFAQFMYWQSLRGDELWWSAGSQEKYRQSLVFHQFTGECFDSNNGFPILLQSGAGVSARGEGLFLDDTTLAFYQPDDKAPELWLQDSSVTTLIMGLSTVIAAEAGFLLDQHPATPVDLTDPNWKHGSRWNSLPIKFPERKILVPEEDQSAYNYFEKMPRFFLCKHHDEDFYHLSLQTYDLVMNPETLEDEEDDPEFPFGPVVTDDEIEDVFVWSDKVSIYSFDN
ncbi:hypothetical protein BK816_00240 [Boudabousia tangfeifanii]|uniref:Uncharacterized protein n=1 Tax=Boudabousia tangfeifanii TaxID=1912795 RepID=A0A1D9MHX1_9ACTO|nr:hypothetical protein [Boudabousia tangfeifanii]AOZ71911.1 hypothetical protein BK816_00240 [Boudabousia tangfeifanii]